MNGLIELPIQNPILLDNETCVYCGTQLNHDATKEHVIGRRFVPKGKLNRQWNLIVRACKACNNAKSELENDISAISMQKDAWGRHVHEDESLILDSVRKANNSISRRTGRRIKDSSEQISLKAPLGHGAEFTFTVTAPPQVDSERVYALCRLQLIAFFYWLTYNNTTKRGHYWLGGYYPLLESISTDWGNVVHKAFMDGVVEWEPRLMASSADGFFKVAIRRHPDASVWSWALEWNKKYRIVGFFGEKVPVQNIVDTFPPLHATQIAKGPNYWLRSRSDVPLKPEEDKLFDWEGVSYA